jgi:hypothetical protein
MVTGRATASVLWGAIGALSFLILAEAYLYLGDASISLTDLLLAGGAVLVLASLTAYLAEPRVAALAD